MKNNSKICKRCHEEKDGLTDFYICKGYVRPVCKKCMCKDGSIYLKKMMKLYPERYKREFTEERREKSLEYYSKHKKKFAKYREAFREKHPDYFRMYAQKRRSEGKHLKKSSRVSRRHVTNNNDSGNGKDYTP